MAALKAQTSALLKRGFMALEDGEFDKANDFFEQGLNNNVENGRAYWGKMLCGLKVKNPAEASAIVYKIIDEQKTTRTIEVPAPDFANIARKVDGSRKILSDLSDGELNDLLSELNTMKSEVESSGEYYRELAETIDTDKLGKLLCNKDYDKAVRYADDYEINCIGTIIQDVKVYALNLAAADDQRIRDVLAYKELSDEIAERLANIEPVFNANRDKILEERQRIEPLWTKAVQEYNDRYETAKKKYEEDYKEFQLILDKWNKATAEYETDYDNAHSEEQRLNFKLAQLKRDLIYTKGLFSGKKKKELENSIKELQKKLSLLHVPENPGEKPEAPELQIEAFPEKGSYGAKQSPVLDELQIVIKTALSPSWGKMYEIKSNLKDGGSITFGSYPTEADGTKKPVDWLVLKVENQRVLLVSKDGLDVKKYHKEKANITWAECSLRHYMNEEMYNTLFNPIEKNFIQKAHIENRSNVAFSTIGGKDTDDYLFLLSLQDVKSYFKDDRSRCINLTPHAAKKYNRNDKESEGSIARWWLRAPGRFQDRAVYINYDGSISFHGELVHMEEYVIRPACWISLLE